MVIKFCRLRGRWTQMVLAAWVCCSGSTAVGGGAAGSDASQRGPKKAQDVLKIFHGEFVQITPGQGKFPKSFEMGSKAGEAAEQPVHRVTFAGDFWMAKYEVPQNLYEAVMGENPSRWKGPRNSVEMLDVRQAHEFCRRVTEMLRQRKLLAEDEEIRLPTEAEWEYCCRAGTTSTYSFGDKATADGDVENEASLLDPYAWHTGNAAGNDPPVGALKPNPWGLYDMHGYLWEFVADGWNDDYQGVPNDGTAFRPESALEKEGHVVARGGSWKDRYDKLRSAARKKVSNGEKDDAIGFRCVKARVSP